ncbi:MAG: hypothetical protein MJ245_04675 [Clostridia bacterium]|nr:hypothetical protein [Clostridia bacterium]
MIAIATGFDALDKKIEENFRARGENDLQIVNYREFLIQQPFECVIMSKNLVGQVELEYLVLSLRERNTRIIYLTNEKDLHELKTCLDYGVYDLIFDPISPENVVNTYFVPKNFADVKKVFMIVNSPDNKQKSKDLEKLVKMGEMQHVSMGTPALVQNHAEAYDDGINQKVDPRSAMPQQTSNGYNNQVMSGGYDSAGVISGQQMTTDNTPHMGNGSSQVMPGVAPSAGSMPEVAPMPAINPAPQPQSVPSMPAQMPQPGPSPVQAPSMGTDASYEQREVRPLSDNDFPNENKKRVIRETQIESVYQIPNDYKKTIVIMSPESCGKTTLAVNMAWYYAQRGIKTTLIDTDLKKKDIYYNFPIDTAECLSKVSVTEDVTRLGIAVDKNLKVYTEHKDVQVNLELYDLVKLITASKRVSQVVIVDLDYTLDQEMIKNVLEIADNILVVVDQKVTTLNRVPEELYTYRNQLQSIDLVVNRFYNIRHLEKERVADFFRGIEIYNGKTFDIKVNRIFTISDDAKSVLQGLAERTPSIEIRDNILDTDIGVMCDYYYMGEKKKRGLF